jgi:hypothetical protein
MFLTMIDHTNSCVTTLLIFYRMGFHTRLLRFHINLSDIHTKLCWFSFTQDIESTQNSLSLISRARFTITSCTGLFSKEPSGSVFIFFFKASLKQTFLVLALEEIHQNFDFCVFGEYMPSRILLSPILHKSSFASYF